MGKKTAIKPLSAKALAIKAESAPTPTAAREAAFQHIAAQISEFFDVGYLVVSWTENGETFSLDLAIGNKFAIRGMVEDAAEKLEMDTMPPEADEDLQDA